MIPKKRRRNKSKSQDDIGLSCRSYYKVSKNIDYVANVPTTNVVQYEYAIGGSYTRISNDKVQPYTTEDKDKYKDRPTRGCITKYSLKSRQRFMDMTAKINKGKVDPKSVLFISLTAPATGWREISGKEWKKRLNNFLTLLRQKYKHMGICGFWRLEFGSKRKAPHFHLITYGIRYIDHGWIAEKWSNICSKELSFREKQKHLMAGTSIELAKKWNAINDYCSKTMAYVQKDEDWKHKDDHEQGKIDTATYEWMQGFGAHWGVICKDNLNALCDIVRGEFKTDKQYHQTKRIMRKYVQSTIKRKLVNLHKDTNPDYVKGKGNYNFSKGKKLDKIFNRKHYGKYKAYIKEDVFIKILNHVGLDVTSLGSNLQSVTPVVIPQYVTEYVTEIPEKIVRVVRNPLNTKYEFAKLVA